MVYCDYTASGRCLRFIENYLMRLQRVYANTHTEDDITGRNMSHLLREAEKIIKQSVNAGPGGKIIAQGYGSTAAIDKLQQIIGVRFPPRTRQLVLSILADICTRDPESLHKELMNRSPCVFLGGYEHHSNELTWLEGFSRVVKIGLNEEGSVDLDELDVQLKKYAGKNRILIGSFSAASNVTGILSPVHKIASMIHRYGGIACFDYAACAPYVTINMNPPGEDGEDPSLDAVFISPHKFIGGPGSSGVLVFNERIYSRNLPPSLSGGGTVDYVGYDYHDYIQDIEEREKAGTPGVLQTMKGALAFMVKDSLSPRVIHERESEFLNKAFGKWKKNPNIKILGNPDPEKRIAIVSFVIKDPWGTSLHPKFITVLLNDLFGIQSRAGCSCAGPYGHMLLNISAEDSGKYRDCIRRGFSGMKPGWCRVGFHYAMDDNETEYVVQAVDFLGSYGYRFLPLYSFDCRTGMWAFRGWTEPHEEFTLENAVREDQDSPGSLPRDVRKRLYDSYMKEAYSIIKDSDEAELKTMLKHLEADVKGLQFFPFMH